VYSSSKTTHPIRRSLRATLTALGLTAGEASNDEEELLRMQATEYEVILLDINRRGIGGRKPADACDRVFRELHSLAESSRR
jgi:CheY-like chemotaxis protein